MFFLRRNQLTPLFLFVLTIFLQSADVDADSRSDLTRYMPRHSYMVIGADFQSWRNNDVFLSMEQKGQIWSYEGDSEIMQYFEALKIDPRKDVRAFVFSRYVNPYGNSGKVHLFDVVRDVTAAMQNMESTPYLSTKMYRLSADTDRYVAYIAPSVLATGALHEVKTAIDVAQKKVADLSGNVPLHNLYLKVPKQSGVWGISVPLSRRKAASVKAKQSTNPFLEAFESYYFYGVPAKGAVRSHFYGKAIDEKQATVVNAFMIGTLTVTKFRANDQLAEMLDQINIERKGKDIHITAVITREMIDAYFDGKLGF